MLAKNIISERKKKLRELGLDGSLATRIAAPKGIIIVLFPKYVFALDGIAEMVSKGFFNFDEFPVYDTWIYFIPDEAMAATRIKKDQCCTHIISWVPDQFSAAVLEAMPQNIDFAICTLEDAIKNTKYLECIKKWSDAHIETPT